jgi:exopolyphosphatase/guanosine-5'-triphosphate,3'-diphosphate pyrophosphatase
MSRVHASIDIGTHTARLLIAQKCGIPGHLMPLARKREYIRLAEGLNQSENKDIPSAAIDRTVNVLKNFSGILKRFGVHSVNAVATGVIRDAPNADQVLNRIYEKTGIQAKVITGVEEAYLTAKGALHTLNIHADPFAIFDLGGGSTEFLIGSEDKSVARSVPLGAVLLTTRYFGSDPPGEAEIEALSNHVDQCLLDADLEIPGMRDLSLLVGTGGTVTTLAAMLHGIQLKDISSDRINGLLLKKEKIEALFSKIRPLSLDARMKLPGLDKGRADAILAGCLTVLRILFFFRALHLTASLSDLLEGILVEKLEGEKND